MSVPADYTERVYAGVLGKLIGVYLGRPVEGWTYERIDAEVGEIDYYVNGRVATRRPLVLTDDDITGTFVFLRALADNGYDRGLSAAQIGETWLNYLIEGRTVIWWGGLGNSTEHTAYLRLKQGVAAPASGSAEMNDSLVAEQIGAQIFIDGWAMVAPGDPQLASDLARRAASVSHDGEAIYAAQALAAMEALAFVEADITKLLDAGLAQIPHDCVIARLIDDVRTWHASGEDWRQTRTRIEQRYGYDTYGGNCHVVPNHALIVSALLHGEGELQRSLMIVNSCGWDTDCNSGNLGCLLGIRGGLAAIDAGPDWRGPVADRLYLPSADGGGAITDALAESFAVINTGRALAGMEPLSPKRGARFHFELPGSVQGFRADDAADAHGTASLENVPGHSEQGTRSLAVRARHLAAGRLARVVTATFIGRDAEEMDFYEPIASPTLYPGQRLEARISADASNGGPLCCRLLVRARAGAEEESMLHGPPTTLEPGQDALLEWAIPSADPACHPIVEVGVELAGELSEAVAYLDNLTWSGAPELELAMPGPRAVEHADPPTAAPMWQRAWTPAVDRLEATWEEALRLVQDEGTGLAIQGCRDWVDYRARAVLRPHMLVAGGLAVRVQGLRRYYALLLDEGGVVRLVKRAGGLTVLGEQRLEWRFGSSYELVLEARGSRLRAFVDGSLLFEAEDPSEPLAGGGIGLLCTEGRLGVEAVGVGPVLDAAPADAAGERRADVADGAMERR